MHSCTQPTLAPYLRPAWSEASGSDTNDRVFGLDPQVFTKSEGLYAFKGLVGRLAPIAVHVSLLAILVGSGYSALATINGTVMVPQVRTVTCTHAHMSAKELMPRGLCDTLVWTTTPATLKFGIFPAPQVYCV